MGRAGQGNRGEEAHLAEPNERGRKDQPAPRPSPPWSTPQAAEDQGRSDREGENHDGATEAVELMGGARGGIGDGISLP